MKEGGDIIKTVLEGFDPKLAGVLVVAGALEHLKKKKKGSSYMCAWKTKESHCNRSEIGETGLIHTSRPPLCGKQKESLIAFALF